MEGEGCKPGTPPGGKGSGAPPSNPTLYGFSESVKKEGGSTGKGEWQGASQTGISLKPLLKLHPSVSHVSISTHEVTPG